MLLGEGVKLLELMYGLTVLFESEEPPMKLLIELSNVPFLTSCKYTSIVCRGSWNCSRTDCSSETRLLTRLSEAEARYTSTSCRINWPIFAHL
jgi:hypothetical protein